MLDEHTIRDGHLTPEALDTLARGACDERDTALLLCHLEACPACMDGYIEAACTAGTDEPAGGYPALESRILTAVTRESRFEKLAAGYSTGFYTLVDRIQAFFIGDDEHDHE